MFRALLITLIFATTVKAELTAYKIADARSSPIKNNEFGYYWRSIDIDPVNTNWIAWNSSPTLTDGKLTPANIDDRVIVEVVANFSPQIRTFDNDERTAVLYGQYAPLIVRDVEFTEKGPFELNHTGHYDFYFSVYSDADGGSHSDLWLLIDTSLNGDLDADGTVTVTDINLFTERLNTGDTSQALDVNKNGVVDEADHSYFVEHILKTTFGDANLDGVFDSKDFVVALATGRYEEDLLAGWGDGDFNGDSRFNSGDMVTALQAGTYESQPVPAVPEPSAIILVLIGLLLRRR